MTATYAMKVDVTERIRALYSLLLGYQTTAPKGGFPKEMQWIIDHIQLLNVELTALQYYHRENNHKALEMADRICARRRLHEALLTSN